MFTISELKKQLGPGLGLRSNKYLLEIPIPGIEGRKLAILCRTAGLPERNIAFSTISHKGRKYNVRGKTDYVGSYEVSIVDDSEMNIRAVFDKWLKTVDNSKPANSGGLASYEDGIGDFLDVAGSAIGAANQIKNVAEDLSIAGDFFLGLLDKGQGVSAAKYQTDINIWQLSKDNLKVRGYKLQNCFPTQLGIVTLDDSNENTLSEFSVVFTFSEFIPLENTSFAENVLDAVIGDEGQDVVDGIESLFD